MATVRRLIDRWNAGDVDGFLRCFAPDAEVAFPPQVPEPGPFHGRDELRRWIDGFLEAWEEHRVEIERIEPAGDDVFAVFRYRARGRDTRIDIDYSEGHRFSFAGEAVSSWRVFSDAEEARRKAGTDG